MDRIKVIWNKIWSKIRDHFSEVGSKAPKNIAVFAVDSLKQLSIKFL